MCNKRKGITLQTFVCWIWMTKRDGLKGFLLYRPSCGKAWKPQNFGETLHCKSIAWDNHQSCNLFHSAITPSKKDVQWCQGKTLYNIQRNWIHSSVRLTHASEYRVPLLGLCGLFLHDGKLCQEIRFAGTQENDT